jgi:hypothetical protein
MKIQIKQYKYEKIVTTSMDFELPEETCYFFETGIRRSIRIKPIFTTWNKEQYDKEEELYQFEITCVYLSFECKIERFTVNLSDFEKDKEVIEKNMFLRSWVNGWFNKRTKEDFEADLKQAIEKLQD